MRIFRSKEDSLRFGLSFFLLLGAVCGSVFCNGMTAGMKADLLAAEQSMVTAAVLSKADFSALFLQILPKRLWMLLFLFLISATQAAPFLFMAVAGYFGFSAAVMICPLTMDAGVFALWKYLLLIFPQCLVYVPIAYILIWWMPTKQKRITVPAAMALMGGIILGTLMESFLNPWFLTFL